MTSSLEQHVYPLEQHVYGSTARTDFETLASSPGIDASMRRTLKSHELGYPARAAWSGESAPFIVRGFRLGPDDDRYGVSLLKYVGPSLDRDEGNYIAHSYVLPADLVATQNYNLPWIAAHLPCKSRYQPSKGSGSDDLPPFDAVIDPREQGLLFDFVLREMTPGVARTLMRRYVTAHGAPAPALPCELPMGPPHPELAQIFSTVVGDGRTPPGPDMLRLFRLAGLMAVLPASFKSNVSFTVNESSAGTYATRVERKFVPAAEGPDDAWPWFDTCARLAQERAYDQLGSLCSWLSRLLPISVRPHVHALDLAFDYYNDVVMASAADLDPVVLLQRILAFKDLPVAVEVLYETIAARILPAAPPAKVLNQLHLAIATVAASTRWALAPAVIDGIVARVTDSANQSDHERRAFVRALPEAAQADVWRETFAVRVQPGFVIKDDRTDPDALGFALAMFKPSMIANAADRTTLIGHFGDALALSESELWPDPAHHAAGLATLAAMRDGDGELRRRLAEYIADAFVATLLPQMGYTDSSWRLWKTVEPLLYEGPLGQPQALAEFTLRVCEGGAGIIKDLLLSMRTDRSARARTAAFLGPLQVHWRTPDPFAASIAAILELLRFFDRPDRADCDAATDVYLHDFEHLKKVTANQAALAVLKNQFVQAQGCGGLRDLPAHHRFAIGTCYFAADCESPDWFGVLVSTLENEGKALARWMVSQQDRSPRGPAGFLARFLCATHEGGLRTDRAWQSVQYLLEDLPLVETRCILQQLRHYLPKMSASWGARSQFNRLVEIVGAR